MSGHITSHSLNNFTDHRSRRIIQFFFYYAFQPHLILCTQTKNWKYIRSKVWRNKDVQSSSFVFFALACICIKEFFEQAIYYLKKKECHTFPINSRYNIYKEFSFFYGNNTKTTNSLTKKFNNILLTSGLEKINLIVT